MMRDEVSDMKNNNWIIGITDGKPHEHKIGNVTFSVFSEFEPTKSRVTIKDRLGRSITSEFAHLTDETIDNNMIDEYVCSAVGKED